MIKCFFYKESKSKKTKKICLEGGGVEGWPRRGWARFSEFFY